MAGGKLTPRQKMINLMYLVFIAMMALNMSKEVLSAFGLMNERLADSNAAATTRNQAFMEGLNQKAQDSPDQYKALADKAKQMDVLASEFTNYIEGIKTDLLKGVKDAKDYEVMDKSKTLDDKFFVGGDKYSKDGQEFVDRVNKFRTDVIALLGTSYPEVQADINNKFSTGENGKVKDREGKSRDWLEYHYKGFPQVASLTKLTQMQADVKTVESEVLGKMLAGNLAAQVSMTNYKAIFILDKNAFYQGESVTGKVVLGRYDENTKPSDFKLSGGQIDPTTGELKFSFGAGAVGEHIVNGEFIFKEDGKDVPIPIEGKYVVIPRPNEATISADKMNSIYRGVENPMSISFAGVADNKVVASAPGLSKVGNGKYVWRADGISGAEATVSVTATMEDGKKVSSSKVFKVRHIPAPVAQVRGLTGSHRGNKNDLINSTINVAFPDFVFDVTASVTQFEVSVPGQARVVCQGNRLSPQAIAAINSAKRGDIVAITNVKSKVSGIPVKDSAPFTWEVQ